MGKLAVKSGDDFKGFQYIFVHPKKEQVYMQTSGGSGADIQGPKTLQETAVETRATSIAHHGNCTPEVPKTLAGKRCIFFEPLEDGAKALL
eukprot:9358556-Heterocapsa_arctica.AAC.1